VRKGKGFKDGGREGGRVSTTNEYIFITGQPRNSSSSTTPTKKVRTPFSLPSSLPPSLPQTHPPSLLLPHIGGERIDVFHLPFTSSSSSSRLVHARWLYVLAPPLFQAECMGTLNDLVVLHSLPASPPNVEKEGRREGGRGDEVYVTHYRAFPDSVAGRLVPGNVLAG